MNKDGGYRELFKERRFMGLVAAFGVAGLGDPLTTAAVGLSIYGGTKSYLAVSVGYLCKMLGSVLVGLFWSSLSDRLDRRQLIAGADLIRALVLLAIPVGLHFSVYTMFPLLVGLGVLTTLVTPARMAAVPGLVASIHLERANGLLQAAGQVTGIAGYALAGILLLAWHSPDYLYVVTAGAVACAAALTWVNGAIGGGGAAARLGGGFARAFANARGRIYLFTATFMTAVSSLALAAILGLANTLKGMESGQAYAFLLMGVSLGLLLGMLIGARVVRSPYVRAMGVSMLIIGLGFVIIGHSYWVAIGIGVMVLIGLGDGIFFLANQTGLQRVTPSEEMGNMMTVLQSAMIGSQMPGLILGGLLVQGQGASFAFAVPGLVILLAAVVVLAVARQGDSSRQATKVDL